MSLSTEPVGRSSRGRKPLPGQPHDKRDVQQSPCTGYVRGRAFRRVPQLLAMVGAEDDQGVLQHPRTLQSANDPPDMPIYPPDGSRVVTRQFVLSLLDQIEVQTRVQPGGDRLHRQGFVYVHEVHVAEGAFRALGLHPPLEVLDDDGAVVGMERHRLWVKPRVMPNTASRLALPPIKAVVCPQAVRSLGQRGYGWIEGAGGEPPFPRLAPASADPVLAGVEPVIMDAVEGLVHDPWLIAFSNTTPCRASRSMLGVPRSSPA